MSLDKDLGYQTPFKHPVEETLLGIILTGALLTKEGQRILRPFKMTDAQFNVLMLLKFQSEKGCLNQTALGRMLLVNRSNITGVIDRMEAAGLVKRKDDPADRRIKQVEMTATGGRILEKAHAEYFSRIEQIMTVLRPDECGLLNDLLERVRKRLKSRAKKAKR